MSIIESIAGSSRAKVRKTTDKPREKDDYYRTPAATTRAILAAERFSGAVHEPACGDGAMAKVIEQAGHPVIASDLVARGYGESHVDFLMSRSRPCDTLITNPPFRLADEFAHHALHLGYRHIALLARLAWLEGAAREKLLWRPCPPSRVWVFSARQTLWRGDEENPGKGGAIAFAWFVWQAGHRGTQIGWLAP